MVSRGCRNTSLGSGGCVVIVASCEEGAGASSAVGQTPTVHGAAGEGLERALRGPRSRRVPVRGDELDARLQDLPQRRRGRVRPAAGSARGPRNQPAIPVPGRTHRNCRSVSVRAEPASDRQAARSIAVDNLTGAAAQRCCRARVSPVRRSSTCHRAAGTSPPAAGGEQRSAWRRGRRVAAPAVEPAADQPSPSIALRQRPIDAVVP